MHFNPGYSGPREINYLFIDGGALRGKIRNISDEFFAKKSFEIDFAKFTRNYTKVFYYDAIPVQEKDENDEAYNTRIRQQRDFLNSAACVDRVHVYEGDARRRRKFGLQQKKVDVMIAVDMLTHTFRGNMHKATLLTGDNDFKPLIDALIQEGMFVTLWHPCGETSAELMNAADVRYPLNMKVIHDLLTPSAQNEFLIPEAVNLDPAIEAGTRVLEWFSGGVRHVLNKNDDEYIVMRDVNSLNRLNIRHNNIILLRKYCKECLDIDVPDL